MKTVLLAWELGEGLGHAAPLIGLAEALCRRRPDVRPVFAFRDTIYTRTLLAGRDWPIIPAPVPPSRHEGRTDVASYVQILTASGFNRPRELAATLATWDDLLATVEPDLVVAEHSPIACLAARGRYPILVTGTGFTTPPAEMRLFPPFRAGMQPPAIHQRILEAVNSQMASRGQPPLSHLPELLAGDRRAVFTLPHLDPYGPLRRDKLLGPYHGRIPPRPSPGNRSVYLYSRASEPRLDDMVEVLLGLDVEITAFITGPDCLARSLLENRGATIFDRLPDLAEVLGAANIAISHGGAGVVSAALMLGRAQVIVPIHVESEVTATRVESVGSAVVVEPFATNGFRQAIETVLQVRMFHERAAEVASEIAGLDLPADPLDVTARLCEELL